MRKKAFPTISFSSINPVCLFLLSFDIGLLSPSTKYFPSGIDVHVHISSKLKSSVSLKVYVSSINVSFMYSLLFLYDTCSPGRPIILFIILTYFKH